MRSEASWQLPGFRPSLVKEKPFGPGEKTVFLGLGLHSPASARRAVPPAMVDTSLDTSLNTFLEDAEAVLAEERKPAKDPILMFQDLQDQSLRLVQLIEANRRLMGEFGDVIEDACRRSFR